MMPFLHTRSKCDACGASVATIERNGCWLCSSCDTTFSEFIAPSATPSDVNAPVSSSPAPVETGATLSDPTLPPPQATSETSVNCGEASVSSLSSSRIPGDWDRQAVAEASSPDLKLSAAVDPGPCGFDFEADLSSLEAQWALDGIFMNSRTFAASVINESISQSSE
jgi:hypothetical protein